MKKISSLAIFTLLLYVRLYSQTLRHPVAAGYVRFGADSIVHNDIFSFTANQASLSRLNNPGIALYGEKRFMLRELSLYHLAIAVPTKSGNFGIAGSYYGFSDYNESQAGIAYARRLGARIDIGVQFNYNALHVAGYGSAAAVSAEAGVILHVSDKLHAGVHVNNPSGAKYNKGENEKLPFVYTAGLGYDASENFFVSGEIEKQEDQPVSINACIQYKFLPQLMVRGGLSSAPASAWLGAGVSMKSFRIDAAASYHPQLGITPGLMLVINLKPAGAKEQQSN